MAALRPTRNRLALGAWCRTFETIKPYTIEEAYEVADAIERADMARPPATSFGTCCCRSSSTPAWPRK